MSLLAGSLNKRVKRNLVSILEFAEAPWGPQIDLTPAQRFSVKLIYKIPLDSKVKDIRVWDKFKDNLLYTLSETEYRHYLHEEGRLNLSTDDAHLDGRFNTFIRCWGRRSGKTLSKSTIINTYEGLRSIESLWPLAEKIKNDYTPLLYPTMVMTDQGWKQATEIYYGGVKKIIKLSLSNGLSISPSPEHKFRTIDLNGSYVWRLAGDLKVGDTLCIRADTPTAGILANPEEINTALFLGMLYGDGWWGPSRLGICSHKSEVDLVKFVDDYLSYSSAKHNKHPYTSNDNVFSWDIYAEWANSFCDEWGLQGYSQGEKKVTPKILALPPEARKAFLSGLLATDGHVTKGLGHFEITLKPRGLIEDIQQLFLSLGVNSTIHRKIVKPRPGNNGGTYWRLTTVGTNTNKLQDIFKYCPLKRKTNELIVKDAKHSYKSNFGAYNNLLPRFEKLFSQHSFGYHTDRAKSLKLTPYGLNTYYSYYQKYVETYRLLEGMSPQDIQTFKKENNRRTTGLEIGRAISKAVEDFTCDKVLRSSWPSPEFIKDLDDLKWIFDNIIPLEIVSIEETEDEVYDLHVPDGNTYLANGIISHNSEITALDMAYGIYLLLEKYDPHDYYHMPPNSEIFIPVLATSQDSSKRTFRKVRNMLASSGYFSSYCNKEDLQELFCKIYTPQQRENKAAFPSIIVQAFPLAESQVRGPASFRAVCDEVAHWPHRGATSDVEVLKAIEPSLNTFKPCEDVPTEAMIFLISNAGVRSGVFFEMSDKAIREGDKSTTIFYQASTQELNPTRISSNELKDYFNRYGDAAYRTEHLSEFVDSITQWLSTDELNCMFDQERFNNVILQSSPSKCYTFFPKAFTPQYFFGFDLGLKNDAAAMAICHWETNELLGTRKLVFDYVERRKAGEGKYVNKEELTGEDMAEWIFEMSRIYPITDGVYDQWSGTLFGQILTRKGVHTLRMEPATEALNSMVYLSFRSLSLNRELDIPSGGNKDLETELQLLQCETRANERISVKAPAGADYHDDMADAIARACWVSMSYLDSRGANTGVPTRGVTIPGTASGNPTYMRNNAAMARIRQTASTDVRSAAKLMTIRKMAGR